MHARRHRMNRVQKRGIISDIFGGDTLPTLSFPTIVPKPTETSSSASQSSSVTSSVVTSSTESSSSSSSVSASSTSSSTSSTVSSTTSTSSQTPTASPPPSSSTIEQTAPNGSTSTLIVQATETASPSQTPSTVGSGNATGFLHNKVASGVVFALVGLIGLFLILALVMFTVRAKRKAKLHQEAVSFEPTIQPEALDNYSDEKGQRRTPSPRNSHDKGYYQQTNAAFQHPGYDFGTGNYSQQYYPAGPVQLPSALYGPERARDAQPGHWNSGMASSSM